MKSNIVSVMISIVVLIVSLVVLPTYFKSIEDSRDDAVRVQNAMRNFLDVCIDNQCLPEQAIADLNLDLAACTATYSYTIRRDQKIVTPLAGGGYAVSWVTIDVAPGDNLVQGDFIVIEVKQETLSIYQRLAAILSANSYTEYELCFTAMVR